MKGPVDFIILKDQASYARQKAIDYSSTGRLQGRSGTDVIIDRVTETVYGVVMTLLWNARESDRAKELLEGAFRTMANCSIVVQFNSPPYAHPPNGHVE